jgi:hypothetical protein
MLKPLRIVAVPLIAGGIVALTTASAWAISQQVLTPNGNYDFNYGSPDDKAKFDSTNKSNSNTPGFHFSVEPSQPGSFGFHNFNDRSNSNNNSNDAWDRFTRPLGNGN